MRQAYFSLSAAILSAALAVSLPSCNDDSGTASKPTSHYVDSPSIIGRARTFQEQAASLEHIPLQEVPYTAEIDARIRQYNSSHPDIGVAPELKGKNLTGLTFWARNESAGYTGMEKDISDLVIAK